MCKHFLVTHFKEQFDAQLFALVVQKYPLNHALCSIAQKYCKCHRWPILRILPFTELRYPGVYFLTMEIWCMKKLGKIYTPASSPPAVTIDPRLQLCLRQQEVYSRLVTHKIYTMTSVLRNGIWTDVYKYLPHGYMQKGQCTTHKSTSFKQKVLQVVESGTHRVRIAVAAWSSVLQVPVALLRHLGKRG